MKSVELGAYSLNDKKNIQNLKQKLRTVCNEWGLIDEQIASIVTDGGANIKGAVKQEFGNSKHISCFGHIINNIRQRVIEINVTSSPSESDVLDRDVLDDEEEDFDDDDSTEAKEVQSSLRNLLIKVKKVVRFFRSSEIASKELKLLQEKEWPNRSPLKLIQEVMTRWNSCYNMIDRFIALADFVSRVLLQMQRDKSSRSKPPNMLTGDELEALIEAKDLLRPLWQVTNEVCGEKFVTLSKCIPLIRGLKEVRIT